jgi:cytochrome P450
LHHDSRFFPEPQRFDPQRWTTEARESRPQFSYFPFGGGPRRCIGEGFAWMEGILLIATLARQWRMRLAPDQQVEVRPVITLRPKHGMRMTLTRRS